MGHLRNVGLKESAIEELERQIRELDSSIADDEKDINHDKRSLVDITKKIYSSANGDILFSMPLVDIENNNQLSGALNASASPPSYYDAIGQKPAPIIPASQVYSYNPDSDYAARRSTVKDKDSDSDHTPPHSPENNNRKGNGSDSDSDSPTAEQQRKSQPINSNIAYTAKQMAFSPPNQQEMQRVDVRPKEEKEKPTISKYAAELIAKYGTSKVNDYTPIKFLASFEKFTKREMVARAPNGIVYVTTYRDYAENFPEFVQINSAFKNNLSKDLISGSSKKIEVIPQGTFESLCERAQGTPQEFKNVPKVPKEMPYHLHYDYACMILTTITDADGKIHHEYEWDFDRADPNYNKPKVVENPAAEKKCKDKCAIM